MKEGLDYGDPVWVAGSTGKRLPGTLVGETKTKARVKLWKASQWRYGPIQTYPWDKVTKAKGDHVGEADAQEAGTLSFL